MTYVIIALRIIHIVAGAFWVGSALIMSVFIAPTAASIGETGQKFMGHLILTMKYGTRVAIAAGVTILAGVALFWIDSKGFTSAWMNSGPGQGFGIGAAFAIIGAVLGGMIGRVANSMATLGSGFQGKPSAEQATQLAALQKRMTALSTLTTISLLLALIFMSAARYFVF